MLKSPEFSGLFFGHFSLPQFVGDAVFRVKSGWVRFWRSAQEVAHLIVCFGGLTALEATSFVACRRVRKKLHSSAQLLAQVLWVLWFGVRSNLSIYLLTH